MRSAFCRCGDHAHAYARVDGLGSACARCSASRSRAELSCAALSRDTVLCNQCPRYLKEYRTPVMLRYACAVMVFFSIFLIAPYFAYL